MNHSTASPSADLWAPDDPRIDAHLIMDELDTIGGYVEVVQASGLKPDPVVCERISARVDQLRDWLKDLPR